MPDIFTVYVYDNYHYMDESERYKLGDFTTINQAEQAARKVVDNCLAEHYQVGMDASALFKAYKMFGDDPQIVGQHFSAWDYAENRCREMCGNLKV